MNYTLMCKTKELLTFDVLDDGTLKSITLLDKTLLPESLKNDNSILLYTRLNSRCCLNINRMFN